VHVEVRHALADGVVDGHEGTVGAERAHHRARHALDHAEERSDEIGVEIGQSHDVWPRHHKNVTLEYRPAIEERDREVIGEHDGGRIGAVDDRTERAARHRREYVAVTTPTTPRIAPLPIDQWDPELREQQAALLNNMGGKPLNIFSTLANHPKLLKRWLVFANHVLAKNSLPERDRELLILRTGFRCGSEYEWGQHVLIARRSSISDAEIANVVVGPSSPGWSVHDAALLTAADELHEHSRVGDDTWASLSARYSTQQLMDVVFTVGNYHVVAMALNSFGVELDAGVPGWLDANR
jgi:4-carboxymuconolactone decarboxylase